METVVIDNFLPDRDHKIMLDTLTDPAFEWYYSDGQAEIPQTGRFMFNHLLWDWNTMEQGLNSPKHIWIFKELTRLLRSTYLKRIKVNLTTRTPTHEGSGLHYDFSDMKTAIYYVNSNNGYTTFEDGTKVDSVANRAVIFDSNLKHEGWSHTCDEKIRLVANINFR